MNYGKRNSVKKQKKISSKSKMKKKRAGVRIFKGFLIVFLLLIIIGMIGGGLFLKKFLTKLRRSLLLLSNRVDTSQLFITQTVHRN